MPRKRRPRVDDGAGAGATVVPLSVSIRKKLLGQGDESADIQRSNLLELAEAMAHSFNQAGALEPPLDPLSLVRLVSMSATLRPLIDAMATNVWGFGYRFEPVIDLDAGDAWDRVKAAILLERELKAEAEAAEGAEPADVDEPTDDEVKKRIETLRNQMRRERAKLDAFFANVDRKMSFTRIGAKQQVDKESIGYGVIEARRDNGGRLCRLTYAPSWTFRGTKLDSEPVDVESRVRATDISYRTMTEPVRFRRYVQIYEDRTTYFKEFGDRRVMSSKTGKFYKDAKALAKDEPDARQATELLWFALDSSESDVYGQVRWSGCIPGVMGSREQAEVNLLFFRSKAIPPMVVLVSGGRLAKGARERLEELIETEIKGVENFWKVITIEADSVGRGAASLSGQDRVKIELRPLTEAIFKDALWMGYQESNRKELGQAFRLPPMFRGDTEKLNRATARIATMSTEQQVFSPERRSIDFDLNRTVLNDLGIMLWRFRLNSPETSDFEQVSSFLIDLSDGALSVNEVRRVAGKLLNEDFPSFDADWARMPVKLALAGMEPEPLPEEDEGGAGEEPGEAEDSEAPDELEGVLKLRVSVDEMAKLVEAAP